VSRIGCSGNSCWRVPAEAETREGREEAHSPVDTKADRQDRQRNRLGLLTDGSTLIVNLHRDGNSLEATSKGQPGKRIVPTRPGDWLVCIDSTRREVASVRVRIESRPLRPAFPCERPYRRT
jgi:hypothetical protein